MKVIRIYADEDGESHFDELEEPGVEHRVNADFTWVIDAYGLAFKEAGPQGDAPSLGD